MAQFLLPANKCNENDNYGMCHKHYSRGNQLNKNITAEAKN